MYFHTDEPRTIAWLAAVFEQAALHGRKVRLDVADGSLKVKVGEGMWTAPLASTPDPYRDVPMFQVVGAATYDAADDSLKDEYDFNDEPVAIV